MVSKAEADMSDIIERFIELISETVPLEDKVSGVVAGMIERTASQLARFETAGDNGDVGGDA